MGIELEDLRVLQSAESVADEVWKFVVSWDKFARDVVGGQLARATDSIGANIAESFGWFHYGEKLKFLYYARGSLFETKYWLNRSSKRNLISDEQAQHYADKLTVIARQLNAFAGSIISQRKDTSNKIIRETPADYELYQPINETIPEELFSQSDIDWISTVPQTEP